MLLVVENDVAEPYVAPHQRGGWVGGRSVLGAPRQPVGQARHDDITVGVPAEVVLPAGQLRVDAPVRRDTGEAGLLQSTQWIAASTSKNSSESTRCSSAVAPLIERSNAGA